MAPTGPHLDVSDGHLRTWPVEGEPTRFKVESSSAECVVCGRLYKRWQWKFDPDTGGHRRLHRKKVRIGGKCPYKFGCNGTLDVRMHLVDIATYMGHGECSCEAFEFIYKPQLIRSHPDTWLEGRYRCRHIKAARDYALDLSVLAHERNRLKGARGRNEENQP